MKYSLGKKNLLKNALPNTLKILDPPKFIAFFLEPYHIFTRHQQKWLSIFYFFGLHFIFHLSLFVIYLKKFCLNCISQAHAEKRTEY